MIVEFVGSSGAGKSSLVERVLGSAPQGPALVDAWGLVTDRPGLQWAKQPTVRNLVADVVVLPAFTSTLRRDPAFARFASDRLRHHPSTVARWNYLLNVERRVGMQELARRRSHGRIVLADEGALLLAYQLFVYTPAPFERADVERFVELVSSTSGRLSRPSWSARSVGSIGDGSWQVTIAPRSSVGRSARSNCSTSSPRRRRSAAGS